MSSIQDALQQLTSEDNIKSMVKCIKRRIKAKQRLAKAKQQPIQYELWEIAGEAYWIEDGTNNVYDFDTEECIGTYNRKTKEFTIK